MALKPTYTTPLNTKRQKTVNNEPSMTKQEFKDDCDPTQILKKIPTNWTNGTC